MLRAKHAVLLSALSSGAETAVAVVCKQLLFAVIAVGGNNVGHKKCVIADLCLLYTSDAADE